MLEDFDASDIGTGGSSVFLRRSGSGPPLLLLHGVAPLLARRFTVVCADLRGYGRSGCPAWRRTTPLTRNAPWRGRSRR